MRLVSSVPSSTSSPLPATSVVKLCSIFISSSPEVPMSVVVPGEKRVPDGHTVCTSTPA
jgi:hypothetical protein